MKLFNIFSFLMVMGSQILLAQEDSLIPCRNNEGIWGFCKYSGEIVIGFKYQEASRFIHGISKVKEHRNSIYINNDAYTIGGRENSSTEIGEGIIQKFSIGAPKALYDKNGLLFTSELTINKYSEGLAAARTSNYEWTYINNRGGTVIKLPDLPIINLDEFHSGYAVVHFRCLPKGFKQNDLEHSTFLSVIDSHGKFLSKIAYRWIEPFKAGYFRVKWCEKWSFMDTQGRIMRNSFIYQTVEDFSEDRALVKEIDSQYGFIDTKGKVIVPLIYSDAKSFSCGLAAIKNELGYWNFIDKNGKIIIRDSIIEAKNFSENIAAIKLKKGWAFIDKNANFITKDYYNDAHSFSEGMAGVKLNNKWGYINIKGECIIAPKYDQIDDFQGNIAKVIFMGKAGYINKSGFEYWGDNIKTDGVETK